LTYGYAAEAGIRPDAGSIDSEARMTRAVATRCTASKRDPMLSVARAGFEDWMGDLIDHT
jgi:hypothetical protein